MGNVVFQQILHLVGKGYNVDLSKADINPGRQTLRIELCKPPHRHVEFVDMSEAKELKFYGTAQENTEYLISRALSRAEWELDYYIEKEINNDVK